MTDLGRHMVTPGSMLDRCSRAVAGWFLKRPAQVPHSCTNMQRQYVQSFIHSPVSPSMSSRFCASAWLCSLQTVLLQVTHLPGPASLFIILPCLPLVTTNNNAVLTCSSLCMPVFSSTDMPVCDTGLPSANLPGCSTHCVTVSETTTGNHH